MSRTQIAIGLWAAAAAVLIAAAFWAVGLGLPEGWGADRLRLSAGCAAAVASTLIFALLRVSLRRFFHAADAPGAGLSAPSDGIRVPLAILQNTLEQVVLASIAYLAFAASAPAHLLPLLPLFAGLFLLGRLAFWIGYRHGATGRTFGYVLTFFPTLLLYLMLAGFLLGL